MGNIVKIWGRYNKKEYKHIFCLTVKTYILNKLLKIVFKKRGLDLRAISHKTDKFT